MSRLDNRVHIIIIYVAYESVMFLFFPFHFISPPKIFAFYSEIRCGDLINGSVLWEDIYLVAVAREVEMGNGDVIDGYRWKKGEGRK